VAPQVAPDGAALPESASKAPEVALEDRATRHQVAPGSAGDLAAPTTVAPSPPVDQGFVPGSRRSVQRSAFLTLAAPSNELGNVANGIVSVTDRYRGFVMHSSVTSAEQAQPAGGTFDLRIPVRNLQAALRDFSQLADVRARTENADDVTASFRSARTRLQELRAQRRGLLRRLARATTDLEAKGLRSQIRFVNNELDAATQQLKVMRQRTSYAQVAVTLVADEKAKSKDSGLSGGWQDFKDNLGESLNIALRVLGVALPLALLATLAWMAAGILRRRRRESALN
jgi:hypothetical protein